MDVGCNRRISKPSNVKEKYCLHLLATNIEDKQLPWHLILIVREIKNLTPQ